ncbi:MAG: type IV secretion system DNA-binding domain-containing protein [Lachnospiraceae bacterium]|nr:type IV secretion system DNA-binding domain-containing protein [Lachnospiraceae bacterium]
MVKEQIIYGEEIEYQCPKPSPDAVFAIPGTIPCGNPGVWAIDEGLLSRHMLMLGAIGSGKSNAIYHMIRRLRSTMTSDDVMFIFDTKGDYYQQFYQKGDIVISNDERATNGEHPDYWNLFREITIDDRHLENTVEIVKAIFAEKLEKTSQPFFPNAAKDLLRALIMFIIRNEQQFPGGGDNAMLLDALQTAEPRAFVSLLKAFKDTQAMVPYIEDPTSGQTQGVMSELQQGTTDVLIGNFAKKGTLSMRELVRRKGGKVVFIEYDLSIGSVLGPIYQLLFDLAIKEALSRRTGEGNVYFIIDEFRLLPRLVHIDDGVNFGRSLGAKFIIGVQNVEQVFHVYGEERARSMLSGFSTTVSFRLNDYKSREFVKNLAGMNGRITSYESGNKTKGVVEQYRDTTVIQDYDVNSLQIGEALILRNGAAPFRFRFREYDK